MFRTVICVLIFVAIAISQAEAGEIPVIKRPSWIHFTDYEPKNPKSLNELPKNIRDCVTKHLKNRLGETFYNSMTFAGGQVVDIKQVYRKNPNAKNFRWEIHTYDLHFEFKRPEVGVASYTAQILLRSDGSIIKEINLPQFSNSPEKLRIIPLTKAEKTAITNGLRINYRKNKVNDDSPGIDYDEKQDILIWKFSQIIADDGLRIKFLNFDVSAHDGSLIRKFNSEGIR
ncbi:MAG: hypothetical protein A2X82_13920 [Geobacteraceae bacterium GWC2_55_20]|nr:MAG: hypothetical protein A2X82_13920 [Geobacteraceae bacterium GWC2_55_20]OGU19211.1 MAG: hypothetical protein A2X85_02545 [Geobacteraceae bacterium GWF2_54_21]HBA72624.1 hypothetical protein [Geobacter sp.]HCE66660.1 hypothetical protein [Geobacter sp.]